ncbi:uncharacterized protein VTP21DRAFT_483 [Calcarisporiella thermophila]|uniref:uncharacterized protein n=1 Tax=Calcarisporiella thermophila TaxID=911321 RepID=UPI0037447DFC
MSLRQLNSLYFGRVLLLFLSLLRPRGYAASVAYVQHDWREGPEEENPDSPGYWLKMVVITVLVLMGGVFAGLTLALMSVDTIHIQIMAQSGEPEERKHAEKVYALLKRGKHWILVTLLLSNVIVNETLPIIMDSVFGGGWPAVLISTALIVIFGEIIPQAVCVRHGVSIAAAFSWFVLSLMYILYPIAYPIAILLDYFLGEERGTIYRKAELKTLVSLHQSSSGEVEGLTEDEVTIIGAVLDLREKPVSAVMTPLEDVFILSADHILDENTMDEILSAGYSRIPIYAPPDPTNFIGMLLVKQLITYDPEDALKVSAFPLTTLPETAPTTSCLDMLNFMQEGRSHMALVTEDPGGEGGAIGVITLEDIIEELIGEEIIDETDVYVDVHKKVRVVRRPVKYGLGPRIYSHLDVRRRSSGNSGGVTVSGSPHLYSLPVSRQSTRNSSDGGGDYIRSRSPTTSVAIASTQTIERRLTQEGPMNGSPGGFAYTTGVGYGSTSSTATPNTSNAEQRREKGDGERQPLLKG